MTIPVPAAYLYDAVVLYAEALRDVFKENGNSTNGTAIFQKIKSRSYESKLFFYLIFRFEKYFFKMFVVKKSNSPISAVT